jgi:hypothetical protein
MSPVTVLRTSLCEGAWDLVVVRREEADEAVVSTRTLSVGVDFGNAQKSRSQMTALHELADLRPE